MDTHAEDLILLVRIKAGSTRGNELGMVYTHKESGGVVVHNANRQGVSRA